MRPLGWLVVMLLVACVGCQPVCGIVFDVVLPAGADPSSALIIEPNARDAQGRSIEPDRLNHSRTERGFTVEVAYYDYGVHAAVQVWVDVDGDGERGPGDLSGEVTERLLDGSGCNSMSTLATPVVLAPIPPAS